MSVTNPDMRFSTEADVIRSVEKLRRGYTQDDTWNLAQTCWHLNATLTPFLSQSDRTEPTEEERQNQNRLDQVLSARAMPPGIPASERTLPPADADDSAIEDYLCNLRTLAALGHSHVNFSLFGPIPLAKFRDFTLVHAAHHLRQLRSTTF